jgi:hypothetical protein
MFYLALNKGNIDPACHQEESGERSFFIVGTETEVDLL